MGERPPRPPRAPEEPPEGHLERRGGVHDVLVRVLAREPAVLIPLVEYFVHGDNLGGDPRHDVAAQVEFESKFEANLKQI
jgi:hypothetical protein